MTYRITRKKLNKAVDRINQLRGTTYYLDFNPTYGGYMLEASQFGSSINNERLTAREMSQLLAGMLIVLLDHD